MEENDEHSFVEPFAKWKRKKLLQMARRFSEHTSAPGFAKLAAAKRRKRTRYLWMSIIVCLFLATLVHVGLSLYRFLISPIIAESYPEKERFEFPEITICPTSPLNIQRSKYALVQRKGISLTGNQLLNHIKNFWLIANNKATYLFADDDNNDDEAVVEDDHHSVYEFNDVSRRSLQGYALRFNYGHLAQEMIVHCEYQKRACSFLNFTEHFFPYYYRCVTFHLIDRAIENEGMSSALSLILHAGDSGVLLTPSEALEWLQGFKIVIHPHGTIPNFDNEAIYVQTGTRAIIKIYMEEKVLLSKPDRPCTKVPKTKEMLAIDIDRQVISRSIYLENDVICSIELRQRNVLEKCKCISERYPIFEELAPKKYKYCHEIDENLLFNRGYIMIDGSPHLKIGPLNLSLERLGFNSTIQSTVKRQLCHDAAIKISSKSIIDYGLCWPLCNQIRYSSAVTRYHWPTNDRYSIDTLNKYLLETNQLASIMNISSAVESFQNQLNFNKTATTSTTTTATFQENFVKIDLYACSVNRMLVVESWAYPTSAFLSDLGGILGLWIGFSIITIIEIFEFIAYVLYYSIPCFANKRRLSSHTLNGDEDHDVNIQNDGRMPTLLFKNKKFDSRLNGACYYGKCATTDDDYNRNNREAAKADLRVELRKYRRSHSQSV